MTTPNLKGLHHITAITADARENLRFYTGFLGLRLVKKTVNFDDPTTYHLYYGDTVGSPGTALTFFPWANIPRGRPGVGQVAATAFAVPVESLDWWRQRLGSRLAGESQRFAQTVLQFADPDGMPLELVGSADGPALQPWTTTEVAADKAVRGFHSATVLVDRVETTDALLTGALGFTKVGTEGPRTRYALNGGGATRLLDVVQSSGPRGISGAGTVHHIAFDIATGEEQELLRRWLLAEGAYVSDVRDRSYFQSIYFREPNGTLFEIATSGPGFTADEPGESLGTALKLPPQYEAHRAEIERALPPLTT